MTDKEILQNGKVVFAQFDKLKPGEFINLSTSVLYRQDKEMLIDMCKQYQIENPNGYWLNMEQTIFFRDKPKQDEPK